MMMQNQPQDRVANTSKSQSRSGPKLALCRRIVLAFGNSLLLWVVLTFLIFAVLAFSPWQPQWLSFLVIPIGFTTQFARQKRLQRLISHLAIATDCGAPLPQYLYAATVGETCNVARLLKDVAGWLEKGYTLAQSIKVAAPWAPPQILETIRLAEETGSLRSELRRLEQPLNPWPIRHELTLPILFSYVVILWFAILMQVLMYRFCSHLFEMAFGHAYNGLFSIMLKIVRNTAGFWNRGVLIILAFVTYIIIVAYFLRMIFAGGGYRLKTFRRIFQSISWRLPPMRSLARWHSWSITAGILARAVENNLPLPDGLDAAAHAQVNLSARRRLIRGVKLLQRGVSPCKAIRKVGLPISMRIILTDTTSELASPRPSSGMPADSLKNSLYYLEGFYHAKYCAIVEWMKSLIIPVAAIIFGACVLAAGLFVIVPYDQLIKVVEAKGCF